MKVEFKKPIKGDRGFTLLEVMIAIAIIAGVVTAIITSLNYHIGVVQKNRDIVTATFLARQVYEQTRLTGPPAKTEGDFDEDFPGFSWAYAREDFLYPGIKKVTVRVGWDKGDSVVIEAYEEEEASR